MKGLMKNRKAFYLVSGVMIMILFMAGCSKKPDAELEAARMAVENSTTVGSEKYLPDETRKVMEDLSAVQDEIKAQDSKFALLRKYDKAKEMLAKVKADAEKVKADTEARKEEAKNNALAGLESAKASIDEARALLEVAPKGKGSKADIEAMKGDIKGLEDSLTEVQQSIDTEDYLMAIDKAGAIKEKADGVSSQINEALAKVKAGKGGK